MKKIFLVLFFIFGLGLIFSRNSYAIEDVVYNLDSSSTFGVTFCDDSLTNSPHCSDYSYIKFEPVPVNPPTSANNSYFTVSGLYGTRLPTFAVSIIEVNQPIINMPSWNNLLSSLKVTLTNSVSATCPEPTPPACDDPEENSRFIQVVIDAFWKYHIAFAGCAAALIAIFVIYRIIKGLLR